MLSKMPEDQIMSDQKDMMKAIRVITNEMDSIAFEAKECSEPCPKSDALYKELEKLADTVSILASRAKYYGNK